jgi:hypothetical protein
LCERECEREEEEEEEDDGAERERGGCVPAACAGALALSEVSTAAMSAEPVDSVMAAM